MKKKWIIIPAAVVAVIAGACIGTLFYFKSLVYSRINVEAGVSVAAEDFVAKKLADVSFTDRYADFDVYTPGDYPVEIKHGIFRNASTLSVRDTIAPTASVRDIAITLGDECEADVFVDDITDVSEVTVAYAKRPDFTQAGGRKVGIILTDASGNEAVYEAELYITGILPELSIEIGEPVPGVEAFTTAAREAEYMEDYSGLATDAITEYELGIRADGREYYSILKVTDTVNPVFSVKNASGFTGTVWEPADLVTFCEDATKVIFSFDKQPDFMAVGEQSVRIIATDEAGNSSWQLVKFSLEEDTEAPVISGAYNQSFAIGEAITYLSGVSATDNNPEGLVFEVDKSAVNPGEPGTYPVVYTATDASGNSTSKTVYFTMLKEPYSDENIAKLVEQTYNKIITADMDDMQRLRAIYDYTHKHVIYTEGLGHGDMNKAIYNGIVRCKGDCFGFASVAQALLEYGGFNAIMIEKVKVSPDLPTHFWHLVDMGDGYYHFDTCIRKDKPEIFMWNDKLMMLYSNKHKYCHNYDRSTYTVNADGDIYSFYYGEDYERPPFVYGSVLDQYFAAGGTIESE